MAMRTALCSWDVDTNEPKGCGERLQVLGLRVGARELHNAHNQRLADPQTLQAPNQFLLFARVHLRRGPSSSNLTPHAPPRTVRSGGWGGGRLVGIWREVGRHRSLVLIAPGASRRRALKTIRHLQRPGHSRRRGR